MGLERQPRAGVLRRKRGARVAGFVVMAPLVVLSCRQVLGIDDRVVAEGGGGEGGAGAAAPNRCDKSIFAINPVPACAGCLNQHCCGAIDACTADAACLSCMAPDGFCASPETYVALGECVHDKCEEECYPAAITEIPTGVPSFLGDLAPGAGDCVEVTGNVTCNPTVPSQTCNWEAGTACDLSPRKNQADMGLGFGCYLSHRKHINEQCGMVEGLCHFGLTCVRSHSADPDEPDAYRCLRFCCHDDECGDGVCDRAYVDAKYGPAGQPEGQSLGLCVKDPRTP